MIEEVLLASAFSRVVFLISWRKCDADFREFWYVAAWAAAACMAMAAALFAAWEPIEDNRPKSGDKGCTGLLVAMGERNGFRLFATLYKAVFGFDKDWSGDAGTIERL